MDHHDRCGPSQQGAVVDFHWIDQDGTLSAQSQQFQLADCLGAVECHHPEVFAVAVQFGVAAEDGLKDLVDIGGGLDVDFLMGFETDVHIIRFSVIKYFTIRI